MLRYLKSASAPGAVDLTNIGDLLTNITLIKNSVKFSNVTASVDTLTGTIIVTGGVGIGGNVNIGGNAVVSGNISGYYGSFVNNVAIGGTLTSENIFNNGEIASDTAVIGGVFATTVTAADIFAGNLSANSGVITSLVAPSATITNLSSTNGTFTSISAAGASATNLYVDNIYPKSGVQINVGSPSALRITGGQANWVLSTDGNGNLSWTKGTNSLTFADGLVKTNDYVTLEETGVSPGTYKNVVVDRFGRVLDGDPPAPETLESVAQRNATTTVDIHINSGTPSTAVEEGALVVTGGIGVSDAVVANELRSKGDAHVEGTLKAYGETQAYGTLFLQAGSIGEAPLVIPPQSLVVNPLTGSIEFDGDYLYVTTYRGRQLLSTSASAGPVGGTTVVKTSARYNIDISAATQYINVGGNDVDAWDDVILSVGDRVLLTSQTTASENGVYIFHGEGSALTRATDFNSFTGVYGGTPVFVAEGTLNGNAVFQVSTPDPILVGSTNINFVRIANRNTTAIANLDQGAGSGLITKTAYGTVALRALRSSTSWLTVSNADGKLGNITISTSTIPVSSGGTGRTTLLGYLKGVGASILTSNTVPVADIAGIGTIATQSASNVNITGGRVVLSSANVTNANISSTLTSDAVIANTATIGNLNVTGYITAPNYLANAIPLGTNTSGSLTSNAVSVSTTQNVTDTIALMNVVLGKLVPPPPPTFPGSTTLRINSTTTARMANFVQTDRTATGGQQASGGETVSVIRRSSTYTTNTVTTVGPGDTGTVAVYKNGVSAGSVVLNGNRNGTYTDLVIANNQDYHNVVNSVNPNFWYSFDAYATGTVSSGWNEVYIGHTAADSTNTTIWYCDTSAPGTPQFSNTSVALTSNSVIYSSTVPHLTSSAVFTLEFTTNRLSGDTYPTSDTFVTGTAGGALGAPASVTYSGAGITTPLARNAYASSYTNAITTTCSVISGFGSSSSGPSILVANGYATGTQSFAPGVTVLYKTGTSTQIEETSIPVNSVGTGSGNAARILNPGSTDTPTFTASATAFASETSVLTATDATVVGAVLKHDQTNYSTGYLPVGPNLSSGRSGAQYFTFKFTRTVVSKFDIKYTGTLAGLWVGLPGSSIDTTSSLNGWLTLSSAYAGAGIPGAGTGGNGSNGCAVGGTAPLNAAQTNKRVTATFGTVSSSSTTTHEIYVRIKLTTGQTITALSIEAASN